MKAFYINIMEGGKKKSYRRYFSITTPSIVTQIVSQVRVAVTLRGNRLAPLHGALLLCL